MGEDASTKQYRAAGFAGQPTQVLPENGADLSRRRSEVGGQAGFDAAGVARHPGLLRRAVAERVVRLGQYSILWDVADGSEALNRAGVQREVAAKVNGGLGLGGGSEPPVQGCAAGGVFGKGGKDFALRAVRG